MVPRVDVVAYDIEDDIDDEEFECDDDCEHCDNIDCWDNPNHNSEEDYDDEDDIEECEETNTDDEKMKKCSLYGVCEECSMTWCINHPYYSPNDKLGTLLRYSDRCAGYCDDCKRMLCITGEIRRKNETTANSKCDKCSHCKECNNLKTEFNVENLYPNKMIVKKFNDYEMNNITNKNTKSKRKYRKW